MNTTGREVIGTCKSNLLVASPKYPVEVVTVTVKAGAKLEKGTVLATDTDNKCVILGTSGATAAYILAEDVDATTADTTAEAYISGHFARNALIVKDDYTMTAADELALRQGGIYLENAML